MAKQRFVLDLAAEMDNEGTNSQMSDYVSEQEKLVWMFSAYLK
jgi:starvation-inducible DNA-binding protein